MPVADKNAVANQNDARPVKPRKPARSWGDINLTLNRLVREGVIVNFKTNLSSPDRASGIQVSVTAPADGQADVIRNRVAADLDGVADDVEISVSSHQEAA